MLTYDELVALSQAHRDERVLSVYIDGTAHDPARQRDWRVQLDHSLKDVRQWLEGSPHAERVAFEDCVALLEEQLAPFGGAVRAPGWFAFITPSGVHSAGPLPVPMPTFAVWSTGICVAPYMRALKQARPAVIIVADARKARLYQYVAGDLTQAATVHAHSVTEPPSHMGSPPRVGFHTGTRGPTGRDAAQASLTAGTDRMIADVVGRATALAGSDGWILAGGIPSVAGQVARAVEEVARGRVRQLDTLDIHATDAEVAAAAQAGASQLRDAADLQRVAEIVEQAEADGPTALGPAATRHALEQSSVRELYVTERYIEDHLVEAEDALRAALAQGAVVEVVARQVAERLDAHGGLGARLRFRPPEAEAVTADTGETARSARAARDAPRAEG